MPQIPDVHDLQSYLEKNLGRYLRVHKMLVEINSFTANPEGVNKTGAAIAELFQPLGFEAKLIQSTDAALGKHLFLTKIPEINISVTEHETLAFISHLDTVFTPEEEVQHAFTWRQEGNRIYGPGAVDIKGGTVLIYMVMDAIKKFIPEMFDRYGWMILLNASEERLSDDFSMLCKQLLPVNTKACLVFEDGDVANDEFLLVTARKGRATFRVVVEGKSAHAGNDHAMGANAIVQLALTIQKIAGFTDYTRQMTFNVGTISGGVVVNRVPHSAEAMVEMRAFSPQVFEEAFEKMLALRDSAEISSADGYTCKIQVELLDRIEPWPANQKTASLYAHWNKAAEFLTMRVAMQERGGLSDGNYLWDLFPTLDGLGPAGYFFHCSERDVEKGKDQEYVLLPTFVPKALLNIYSICSLFDSRLESFDAAKRSV